MFIFLALRISFSVCMVIQYDDFLLLHEIDKIMTKLFFSKCANKSYIIYIYECMISRFLEYLFMNV